MEMIHTMEMVYMKENVYLMAMMAFCFWWVYGYCKPAFGHLATRLNIPRHPPHFSPCTRLLSCKSADILKTVPKIIKHVITRQSTNPRDASVFEAISPRVTFYKKIVSDVLMGNVGTKFKVCIVFRLAKGSGTNTQADTLTTIRANISRVTWIRQVHFIIINILSWLITCEVWSCSRTSLMRHTSECSSFSRRRDITVDITVKVQ